MDIFVRRVGVGLTHTEKLMIKKLKLAREAQLETEGENAKKPRFGQFFESFSDLPSHYSSNIIVTAADFKRYYKNIEFCGNRSRDWEG